MREKEAEENLISEKFAIPVFIILLLVTLLAFFYFGMSEKSAMPVLIGGFGILPFMLFYRSANRIAPRLTAAFFLIFLILFALLWTPAGRNGVFCLPIPLFIVLLFLVQRERKKGLQEWFVKHNFVGLNKEPKEILQVLGEDKNWGCSKTDLFVNRKPFPIILWLGSKASSTTYHSGSTTQHSTTIDYYVAVSFEPNSVNENFMKEVEALNLSHLPLWKRIFHFNYGERPYMTARADDGSFVVAWMCLHVASTLDARLDWLKETLNKTKA